MVAHLVRLKLTLLRNSLRRSPWQIVGIVLGALYGIAVLTLLFAGLFLLSTIDPELARTATVLAGSAGDSAAGADGGASVEGISWEGQGCSISMASASVLTDLAAGLPRDEIMALVDNFREVMRSRGTVEADEEVLGDAAAFSGVSRYPARVKCAMLAWVAAEDALAQAIAGR